MSRSKATTIGAAADYTSVTATLLFSAGNVTPTVESVVPAGNASGSAVVVKAIGDNLPGPDEVFNATLSKPAGATLFEDLYRSFGRTVGAKPKAP